MVLQRDQPVAIWGWNTPGAPVRARLDEAKTKTDAQGAFAWSWPLTPHQSKGSYRRRPVRTR